MPIVIGNVIVSINFQLIFNYQSPNYLCLLMTMLGAVSVAKGCGVALALLTFADGDRGSMEEWLVFSLALGVGAVVAKDVVESL